MIILCKKTNKLHLHCCGRENYALSHGGEIIINVYNFNKNRHGLRTCWVQTENQKLSRKFDIHLV